VQVRGQGSYDITHVHWLNNHALTCAVNTRQLHLIKVDHQHVKMYEPELYVKNYMPRGNRSAYAQFRCGVAPLRLETGRYEQLVLEQRVCLTVIMLWRMKCMYF
jgi:hypothetical protein